MMGETLTYVLELRKYSTRSRRYRSLLCPKLILVLNYYTTDSLGTR